MNLNEAVRRELGLLERTKTFKKETVIESEQGAVVRVAGKDAVMLASNNYLGLASDPRIKQAAIRGVRDYGYGVSSVRFLCGTLTVHGQLEDKIAGFLGTEDAVLFSSCFAANEGFFASNINEKMDAESYRHVIYSDRLNHASIINDTRLCRHTFVDKNPGLTRFQILFRHQSRLPRLKRSRFWNKIQASLNASVKIRRISENVSRNSAIKSLPASIPSCPSCLAKLPSRWI